jgi:MFS transporter, DHA3 family, tetracycline resistance protein
VKKLDAYKTYLLLEGMSALLLEMVFTVSSIYQVQRVGLSPLQLVLVGTTLEIVALLFEIPTGVVADVFSRRLSVIIGVILIGIGSLVEGTFPVFWIIVVSQVIWGLGYTFTSGATQAWISDEIGEEKAATAFLRANQVGNLAALMGIGAGILVGSMRINLPLQLGGMGMVILGLFLAIKMPETGFIPRSRQGHSSVDQMKQTVRDSLSMVRRRPALITILGIGLIYGLYSEGLDRLWTKHLLDQFTFPIVGSLQPVFWFGLVRITGLLLSTGATEIAVRNIDTNSQRGPARALYVITIFLLAAMFIFALSGSLWLALAAFVSIRVARNVINPVYTAWVNQRLDSSVRATVISMSNQVDAVGQIGGGPIVGLIGNLISVRAALLTSSVILSPVLWLYHIAVKRTRELSGE